MKFRVPRKHLLWVIAGLITFLAICCRDHISVFFDKETLVDFLCCLGHWSVALFIGGHIVATAMGVPGTVLVVVGGMLFGLFWGTIWSVIGATFGAIAAFWLSRYLLRDWFKRRFSRHKALARFNQIMDHQAFRCVLTIRFAPISPFNVVNFLFGLTSVDLKSYAAGTFLGIIPGTLAYTWLGVTGMEALDGKSLIPLFLALSLLVLLSLLPILAKCRTKKA
ncbi:MAG: TVP38/TMEM64 family protein [Leptolyngbyaceae cyanobacterium MO_188.B28]|nr:TVP38/TMEM64 family protein [Leptolyngbyaceae cyanobacterium MO_188.B28]